MARSDVKRPQVKCVVLAYSGGLDTSIIIPWLRENYGCEVVAMVGDVGQGDDFRAVRQKALDTGASKVFVEDLREEFITDRKSTRLNSSHLVISYAVFCLKKKKKRHRSVVSSGV